MLPCLLTITPISIEDVLPGVSQLKGSPTVGLMPTYLRHGMPRLLEKLVAVGKIGISYTKIFDKILVSVNEPAMVQEVLSISDQVGSL